MRQNCIGWQLKLALTLTGKQTSWQPTSRGWLSLDRAAGRLEILTAQLPPHLARRRRGELTSYTRLISGLVRDRAATAAAGVRGRPRAPCARNKRWGDRPLCAHRPDPVQGRWVSMNDTITSVGGRAPLLPREINQEPGQKADALRRISFAPLSLTILALQLVGGNSTVESTLFAQHFGDSP
jgi:hypothetical protein